MTEKLSTEELKKNYESVKEKFDAAAKKSKWDKDKIILLAATKTVDSDIINSAIDLGIEYVGENRVQELLAKYKDLKPVHSHFIGHLQTNKVRDVIDKVEMIESVSSQKLAKEISKWAERKNINMDILLEVNIGNEESKSGFSPDELTDALTEIARMSGIKVKGLMSIPPATDISEKSREYFKKMYKLFIDIKGKNIDNIDMDYLSMGMSSDFDVAIEEGANIVRVGTSIFGKRNYN